MSKVVHGFTLKQGESKVSDVELLALDEDVIKLMLAKLSALNYLKWKLNVLRNVLVERVESSDYDANAQQRIMFTQKAILHTESVLKRFGNE